MPPCGIFYLLVGKPTHSGGYDCGSWNFRNSIHHRENREKHKVAITQTDREHIEKHTGVRYRVLNDLTYMDCARFHAIDPMRILLLGRAKHVMNFWIRNGLISHAQFN